MVAHLSRCRKAFNYEGISNLQDKFRTLSGLVGRFSLGSVAHKRHTDVAVDHVLLVLGLRLKTRKQENTTTLWVFTGDLSSVFFPRGRTRCSISTETVVWPVDFSCRQPVTLRVQPAQGRQTFQIRRLGFTITPS